MKRPALSANFSAHLLSLISTVLIGGCALVSSGCGANPSSSTPKLAGSTNLAVMLSSTANDQLSQFNLEFETLTLTNQSGASVNLLMNQQPAEFMHVNGGTEPLTAVTIPQDIYVSAKATIGGASFTCVTILPPGSVAPGNLDTSTYAYGYTPDSDVTVNLPSPITITGDSMVLVLDLQVSNSASYPGGCYPVGTEPYSITPTFNLMAATFSSQPSNPTNGKVTQLEGQITAISATDNSLTVSLPEPNPENTRTLAVSANESTIYQGINGFSALAVGAFVDMDGTIQKDASLQATRIAVEDPSAVDVLIGPVMHVAPDQPTVNEPSAVFFSRLSAGKDPIPLSWPYSISGALFQVSQQISLQGLPFVPVFNASSMVAGQNVYVTSQDLSYIGGVYTPATTITLMPQTINGTVAGSSRSGDFTEYTVSLAAYDLFPTLAVQQGQTTLLSNPGEVQVYVNNSTNLLNIQPLAAGSTLRFYGLVFNDNGTLRMACAQVSDGVAFSTQSSHVRGRQSGQVQITRRAGAGRMQQVNTLNKSR
ncbi:MAG TPA: DUF5666 domain-containing protein [Candidatus Sulfotelmatobacter sp.]|nr:DUF5666 domain-containing protein [Candidatus Sulfotelmatobacter sp.]